MCSFSSMLPYMKSLPLCISNSTTTKASSLFPSYNAKTIQFTKSKSPVNPLFISGSNHSSDPPGITPPEFPSSLPPEFPTSPPEYQPFVPQEVPLTPNVPDFDTIPTEKPSDPPPLSPGPNPEFPGPPMPSRPGPEGPQPPMPSPPGPDIPKPPMPSTPGPDIPKGPPDVFPDVLIEL